MHETRCDVIILRTWLAWDGRRTLPFQALWPGMLFQWLFLTWHRASVVDWKLNFFITMLYILFACLYCMFPYLSFFLYFFLTYLLCYLSFPLRMNPLHFQAGCRKRRLKLALVFELWYIFSTTLSVKPNFSTEHTVLSTIVMDSYIRGHI